MSTSARAVSATDAATLADGEPGEPRSQRWPIGASVMPFAGPDGRSLTDAPASTWHKALREVSSAGFRHVDLTDSWVRPGDLSDERLGELTTAAQRFGLRFSAISVTRQSVVDPDEDAAEANFRYSMRTVEAAARLGVPVVCLGLHRPLSPAQLEAQWFWHVTGAEDAADPAVRARAIDRFRQIGEHAAGLGVEISLEMYEGTYLEDAERSVEFIDAIDLSNVGLNPDIGNIVRLHRPVQNWEDMLRITLPRTNYWHVKNYLRDFDPVTGAYFTAPAPLETGYINYRRAIEMALEVGFDGPLCVEHYGGDGLSVCAANHKYLRRILAVKLGE